MFLVICLTHSDDIICYCAAMKIQITQATKNLLDNIGGYITAERGAVAIKVRLAAFCVLLSPRLCLYVVLSIRLCSFAGKRHPCHILVDVTVLRIPDLVHCRYPVRKMWTFEAAKATKDLVWGSPASFYVWHSPVQSCTFASGLNFWGLVKRIMALRLFA